MHILQGTWIPNLSSHQSPSFFLWGEHETTVLKLEIDELENAVNAVIGKKSALVFSTEKVRASLDSPDLGSSIHELSGVAIQVNAGVMTELLKVICSVAQPEAWRNWGFAIGDTLSFWSRIATLSLELLSSEHFIPGINDNGSLGIWDAVLDDPRIEHRLMALTATMPFKCDRIYFIDDKKPMGSRVEHFIKTSVDLFVREQFEQTEIEAVMQTIHLRYAAPLTPSDHWFKSLFSAKHEVGEASVEWIAEDIVEWRNSVAHRQNEYSFRTCFRLEEPSAPDVSGEQRWMLTFLLQAADDPSLLVPAEFVWKEASETLEFLNYRFHEPQERLLSDLDKAGKLFKPILRSLKSSNPDSCDLDTSEAHLFLKRIAPELSDQGFGVFVPAWWRKPEAQLGVKMRLTSNSAQETEVKGYNNYNYRADRIGFDAIYNYEWQLALGEDILSREEFEQLASLKQPLVQRNGQWIEFQTQYTEDILKLFEEKGIIKLSDAMHLALNLGNEERALMDIANIEQPVLPIRKISAEGDIDKVINQLGNDQQIEFLEQPKQLQGFLRAYQLKGFSWLVFMKRLNLGACLADDMGLGKTIQWIAYLLYLKEQEELIGPVLLICPTSVISNWQKEIERFAPTLKVWVHYGIHRLKGEELAKQSSTYDIILTSYAVAMRDEAGLLPIPWDIVTLDEAQNIKNAMSKQAQMIRKLSANHRIALTGTPVENRLAELWSIMDFLNPNYLGAKEQFIQQFEAPIERDGDMHSVEILHQILQPFVLRRLKSDRKVIVDIPEKYENKVYCSLTREQASLYEACVNSAFEKVEKAKGMERRGTILSTLTHLKQICNHPAHYLGDGRFDELRSGKLIRLVEMLRDIQDRGERTLIFTQYAQMAVMLQRFLQQRFKQEVLLIHGRIPKKKRDDIIKSFQEDDDAPSIFVLSLKTGGFGLNLTRANHVIHYDRWWNPAVENQATDRAYRIGQLKNVEVHKYLCAGTLEEKIDQMIENKQTLATRVIGKGEAWITEMSTEDLRQLLMLRNEVLIPNENG